MRICKGKSVFGGVAIGKIRIFARSRMQIKRVKIQNCEEEFARYENARQASVTQLQALYEKAVKDVGEANAAIFQMHQVMLQDEDYAESVRNIIFSQQVNAEYAIGITGDNFEHMLKAMEDEYMRARAADVRDITDLLLNTMQGEKNSCLVVDEPSIVLADDLSPSETVKLDKDKILAFVTSQGSVNSHTAILARTMGIPALVMTDVSPDESLDGVHAVVDGFDGILYIEPDKENTARLEEKRQAWEEKKRLLLALKDKEDVTLDGHKIMLYANIGNVRDLAMVIENDAQGIGLFRSEFLYLEGSDYPTEEQQFQVYKTVAETMAGKRVIIRTMDIGADKQAEYFNLGHEENPALGYRAIRICLTQTDIFKTQLRALFRASAYGNIAVMYPMITSVKEVEKIKRIVEEVKEELTAQHIAYRDVLQGVMIETPAAVMISDELAKLVDFFSIGTNDLTQYTLAIDRQNPKLDEFYEAHHPAVLRMIRMVVENAHKAGIWVGICGELGADTELTQEFIKMGVDELSVSPGRVLPVRKVIRETTFA